MRGAAWTEGSRVHTHTSNTQLLTWKQPSRGRHCRLRPPISTPKTAAEDGAREGAGSEVRVVWESLTSLAHMEGFTARTQRACPRLFIETISRLITIKPQPGNLSRPVSSSDPQIIHFHLQLLLVFLLNEPL